MRITAASLALKISVRGQMKYMRSHGFDVTMVSSPGPEVDEVIAAEGCPHIAVNISRKITPFGDLVSIYKLYRVFRKYKPHVIHSENLKANLLGMIAGWLAKVPVRIQTMAGLVSPNVPSLKGKLIRIAEIISFRFATDVWPNSNSSLQYMVNTGMIKPGKARVIGGGSSNGVDLQKYNREVISESRLEEFRKTIQYKPGERILLFAGRMVKDKGVQELIAAFLRLQEQFPSLKLVLLGPLEEDLDPLNTVTKEAINNDRSIIHINWTDEVEYYFALAELFVFPSHREGFPNVLMQAGAMKVPVVCSDIVGNIDIVDDKKSGLWHYVKQEEDLYQKVLFALNNSAEMKTMADVLYKKMTGSYDRFVLYAEYRDAYIELIKKRVAAYF